MDVPNGVRLNHSALVRDLRAIPAKLYMQGRASIVPNYLGSVCLVGLTAVQAYGMLYIYMCLRVRYVQNIFAS